MKSNNNKRKPHCTDWKTQESSFLIISGHSHSPFLFREREPIHHGDVNAPLILSRPCFLIDQASSEYTGALERREADTPEQTSLTPHETKKEHNLPTAQLNNTTTLPTKDTAIQIPSPSNRFLESYCDIDDSPSFLRFKTFERSFKYSPPAPIPAKHPKLFKSLWKLRRYRSRRCAVRLRHDASFQTHLSMKIHTPKLLIEMPNQSIQNPLTLRDKHIKALLFYETCLGGGLAILLLDSQNPSKHYNHNALPFETFSGNGNPSYNKSSLRLLPQFHCSIDNPSFL